jgi:hypothetical protein
MRRNAVERVLSTSVLVYIQHVIVETRLQYVVDILSSRQWIPSMLCVDSNSMLLPTRGILRNY